jgi:thiosulfate reductase cytochrome b subunit
MTAAIPATAPVQDRVVIHRHHWLVRLTHWFNVPILSGLILSGLSIYWASPVYKHRANPTSGNEDYLSDAGVWIVRHVPGLHGSPDPGAWAYNHFSLGTGLLAEALRLHWFFAYLFMLNGLLYLVGLVWGGGYRSLLPQVRDLGGQISMIRYYLGLLPSKIRRRPWPHPPVPGKYNALQKAAYFSMPVFGALSVLTGWAIHKPAQLGWLQAAFGGYDLARIWHFWLMWIFVAFVIPHVVLVAVDGWDTFRAMIVGWSDGGGGDDSVR